MEHIGIIVLLIIIIVLIIFHVFNKQEEKIYFFLNQNDDKSLNLLNNILKNSKSKVILVNYDKDLDLTKLNKIINKCKKIRPIHDLINIENMDDVTNIYNNKKCINQPSDRFYEIVNKVGVFGYPFDFEDNPSELLNSDTQSDNNKIYNANTSMNRLREVIDVPTCGRRRSGCN